MSLTTADVANRMRRLAEALAELKGRVRIAVALEMGKAVAEAVRDLLTSALINPATPAPSSRLYRSPWDDDPDVPWDDEAEGPSATGSRPWHAGRNEVPRSSGRTSSRKSWPAAFAVAATTMRWWLGQRISGWTAVVLGVLLVVVAGSGSSIARAILALLAAAGDLVPTIHPFAGWISPLP